MPIVFDPATDPVYQEGVKKTRLEDAKIFIEKFNAPIEEVSKTLNIPLEELKRYLNQNNNHIQIKAKEAKEKVISAVNLLKLQGEKITAYKVAKTAKVGYNTARKYLAEIGSSFGL